ncbi:MAG: hypothetical protein HC895_12230 [Leptolyngbyaceae cyanobacterium SM1_3_5]|nr:hypothetical protein [Leptolyngbyaceae cyanobacterium SM1_3_5]
MATATKASASSLSAFVAGSLDLTFGTGGKVLTNFYGYGSRFRDIGYDVVLQPDGKLVVAGRVASTWINADFGLVRYNSDGSIDTTFGWGGTVITDFDSGGSTAYSIALQPIGKLVVAGNAGQFA